MTTLTEDLVARIASISPGLAEEVGTALEEQAAEIKRLKALLADAAEDINHWAGYAGDYFQDRWDSEADVKRYKEASK